MPCRECLKNILYICRFEFTVRARQEWETGLRGVCMVGQMG